MPGTAGNVKSSSSFQENANKTKEPDTPPPLLTPRRRETNFYDSFPCRKQKPQLWGRRAIRYGSASRLLAVRTVRVLSAKRNLPLSRPMRTLGLPMSHPEHWRFSTRAHLPRPLPINRSTGTLPDVALNGLGLRRVEPLASVTNTRLTKRTRKLTLPNRSPQQ